MFLEKRVSRMKIIPMEEKHTEKLAQLEQLCFSRPWSREALLEELENPAAVFLTAVEGQEILGYAGMHCAWGECYLDNIAVFPAYRRQGAARALLLGLEEAARRRNGEFLSLEVRASNQGAIALYQAMGFQEAGRRKNFYTAPREDGLIFTKYFSTEKTEAVY